MNTRLRLTLAVTLVCCGAAEAHHSIAGMYDEGHPVTLDGSVLEFHFVNPHPFVLLKANDQTWKLELDNRWELIDAGMSATTLKPGDQLTVTGGPAYKQPNAMYVRRMQRVDGFLYEQVGFSPKVSGPR
ncbi:MAG: hypothetical protein DMF88_00280 [Acidobacteria bacterium]|nr:MAG: hypothetical protein DMF88_00280 [Acidobacteriota bacterium]